MHYRQCNHQIEARFVVETFGAVYIGPQYRDLLVFGLLVVILLVRPNGLFAKAVKA
mgnify:CR=1 FL=1